MTASADRGGPGRARRATGARGTARLLVAALFAVALAPNAPSRAQEEWSTASLALDDGACATFHTGGTGHLERCRWLASAGAADADGFALAGYGVVIHHILARLDFEILRPGRARGDEVVRLDLQLGRGLRTLAGRRLDWRLDASGAKPLALIAEVDVKPAAWARELRRTVVVRLAEAVVGDGAGVEARARDCVIAVAPPSRRAERLRRALARLAEAPCLGPRALDIYER